MDNDEIMNLNKTLWTKDDYQAFLNYLESFQNKDKEAWSRRILNTKLKLLCLSTPQMNEIVQRIYEGNYISFLELNIFDSYETIAIYGKLLTKIKSFETMLTYLNRYCDVMENWAHCDLLSFNIEVGNKEAFIELSHQYARDQRLFVRRLSLMILFQMVKDDSVLPVIFNRLKSMQQDEEYYVVMMAGWLLCECIIQHKEKSLAFIQMNPGLNKKIINKAIQKCRESRRLSLEEKDELLKYKKM